MYNRHIVQKRNQFTQRIRCFFNSQNFLEVETPILVPIPGMEPHLNPFETEFISHHGKKKKFYLNHSPELQMKKLLAEPGFEKIFNITKVFRNGEYGGGRHNPEFTMLEWYRLDANYIDLMLDCENLVNSLLENTKITYQNQTIDLSPPWPRKSIHKLFIEFTNIDLLKNQDFKTFQKTANSKNYDISACQSWDDIFFKIFLNDIEPYLGIPKPTIVYDYPSSQASLARKSTKNPFWAERFELYIAGQEIANAFSELTDPQEQRHRLQKEQQLRKKLKKAIIPIDEEFLMALAKIKKPAAGIALGLDRLFMVLNNLKSIEETLLFPMEKLLQQ